MNTTNYSGRQFFGQNGGQSSDRLLASERGISADGSRGRSTGAGAARQTRSTGTGGAAGRPRTTGQGRTYGQGRTGGGSSRAGGTGYQHQTSYGGSASYRRPGRRRRKRSPNYGLIAIVGLLLMIVAVSVIYGMKYGKSQPGAAMAESPTETEAQTTELEKEVMVDGIVITGLSMDAAKQEILKQYPWSMKAVYQDSTYEIANLIVGRVEALLGEIYSGEPGESYTLDTSGLEDEVAGQIAIMKGQWNKAPKNGSIASYDVSSDSFLFEGEMAGVAIDEEKLKQDILKALSAKDFDAQITVSAKEVQPEITEASAKEKYKTIGTYTTNTTANKKRNTNVRLAAEKLNGTILGPGQELSFNDTVGERTVEKGYQGAAAYNNGEVVEEIGGGVCQVSTTLYNAVLKAGMKISRRQSHTFEPSYVTPGQDATISWGGPDFKFINTSSAAIGIRASYSNQTVTVSVYGIPVLEEGVTYSLDSKKIEDMDPPPPTYEEDQTLQPGQEVVKSSGTRGSRWQTRLVIKKDGEVISQEVDHTTTYKGHAPVIKRNTSGVVVGGETSASDSSGESMDPSASSESQPESASESQPQILGPGFTQPETSPTNPPEPESQQIPEGIIPQGPGFSSENAPADTIVEPNPGG